MVECELIDYSERPESLIMLFKYPAVTVNDIAAIKDILPDQWAQVRAGDDLSIYVVDNRTEGVGRVRGSEGRRWYGYNGKNSLQQPWHARHIFTQKVLHLV